MIAKVGILPFEIKSKHIPRNIDFLRKCAKATNKECVILFCPVILRKAQVMLLVPRYHLHSINIFERKHYTLLETIVLVSGASTHFDWKNAQVPKILLDGQIDEGVLHALVVAGLSTITV